MTLRHSRENLESGNMLMEGESGCIAAFLQLLYDQQILRSGRVAVPAEAFDRFRRFAVADFKVLTCSEVRSDMRRVQLFRTAEYKDVDGR